MDYQSIGVIQYIQTNNNRRVNTIDFWFKERNYNKNGLLRFCYKSSFELIGSE